MSLELYARPPRRLPPPETPPPYARAGTLSARIRRPIAWGGIAALLLVGGLGGWAATASLAGGAVAEGIVSPEGDRRVVQHLEGGVVRRILVKENDVVAKGDPLLVLENTRTGAKIAAIEERRVALLAEKQRLVSELSFVSGEIRSPEARERIEALRVDHALDEDVAEATPIGDGLIAASRVRAIYSRQQAVLESRSAHHRARAALLRARIDGLRETRSGLEARRDSLRERLALFEEEFAAKRQLADKGALAPLALLSMRGHRSELSSAVRRADSELASLRFDINSAEVELLTLRTGLVSENAERLAEIETELAGLGEELRAERDVMSRTVVPAPVSGRVINLAYNTDGGVVAPGARILEIVPEDERLIVTAKLSPNDVDVVSPGLGARVRFPAFPSRTTPELEGAVLSISPDRVGGDGAGKPYYAVRIAVDTSLLAESEPPLQVVPGMSAEVLIVSERRTPLDYLIEPILSVLQRGMREN